MIYQDILKKEEIDREKFEYIWKTWPLKWDEEGLEATYSWTGLGRFIVAHELSHFYLHSNMENEISHTID